MLEMLAISAGPAGACCAQAGRRNRRGVVSGAILRKLVAAQAARSGSHRQQQAGSHRRRLQAGKIVHHPLAQPLIPAHGRQGVQRLFQPQPRARHQVGFGLQHRVRIRKHLQRQQLLPLLTALRAAGQVPFQLMDLLVGQLCVGRRHDPLVCKFAIHLYVLPASTSHHPGPEHPHPLRGLPGAF